VFDGVQNALDQCDVWYKERLIERDTKDITRGEEKKIRVAQVEEAIVSSSSKDLPEHTERDKINFFTAEPIIDRKSTFIGRACRLSDPSEVRLLHKATDSSSVHIEQVPQLLTYLMSDRRIARATHPIINAWRCQVGTVLHQGKYIVFLTTSADGYTVR